MITNMENTLAFARALDAKDPLNQFRSRFYIPQHNGGDAVYLTGNSLGLQPRSTETYIKQELEDWAQLGVEGHFEARKPWMPYHEQFSQQLASLTGSLPEEVVAMNQLTVNLHLLMVSFYRPTKERFKIICEAKAFPSDQYAIESQVKFHGFDPAEAIVEVEPREGEHTLRQEDILAVIKEHGAQTALVLFGGVNYYTGQVLDMAGITVAAHEAGALAGFDLAHAAGNITLRLHDWQVDFACWCSYKYLNSGPGGVAGAFVHEKHITDTSVPRFAGWWGYRKSTRFKMEKGFDPIPTAEGWQLSNAPVLSMAAHKASLDIFEEAGWEKLEAKRLQQNVFLDQVLKDASERFHGQLEIITPTETAQRGCQVSMLVHKNGRDVFNKLTKAGVIADWREPDVIRIAPVPLYNSFEDIWKFGHLLQDAAGQ